jgi:hypothetical protein
LFVRPINWVAIPALGLAIFLPSSACAQKTSTTFDDKFSFAQHTRYAWRGNRLMTQQNPDTNELMDLKIVRAVNRILSERGFVETKDKPDFYIYYNGGGDMQISEGGQNLANSGPRTSGDPAPTYGLGNGPSMAPSTWLKVKGQIVFYIIDGISGKPVWETTYSKTFHDRDKALRNLDKEVNEIVTKSFKNFPPKSAK